MANFYETVLDVLRTDKRFVAEDGTFLRNAVYEAAMQMDKQLIRKLLENDETCKRFFVDVDARKSNGETYWWHSSVSREDTGDGACEVMYVTSVEWLD